MLEFYEFRIILNNKDNGNHCKRIKRYIESKKISVSSFERAAGLSNGYLNQLRNCPSATRLERIASAFPDLNKDWLLTGEGDMIIGQRNEPTGIPYYDEDLFECGPGAGFGEVMLSGKEVGIDGLQFYAARHTWATIAYNECGVDKGVVGDGLNHVDKKMSVTDRYIRKSWDRIDDAQRKVLDHVFGEAQEQE